MLLIRTDAKRRFKLGWALDLAAKLEHWGLAGFGWGVAWYSEQKGPRAYKSPLALRDDDQRSVLAGEATPVALVHLRRPSKLSTTTYEDTQPFVQESPWLAFAHNGTFAPRWERLRERYAKEGKVSGFADSEVGFYRFLERAEKAPVEVALKGTHAELGGTANLAVL